MRNEVWKEIPGYYGNYAVSNYGRVKRLKPGRGTHIGWISNGKSGKRGYVYIKLSCDGISYQKLLHRLVAEAFLGECPNNQEVNHIDGNKENNRADNLEYLSRSENLSHSFRTGLRSNRGEKNPSAKINLEIAEMIRAMRGDKTQRELGEMFGINQVTVSMILRNKTWVDRERIQYGRR